MSKLCPRCGIELDDSATFCTSCGEPLNSQPQNQNPAPNSNSKLPAFVTNILSLPKKQLLIYGGIALAAIVAIILIIGLIFPSPKTIAKRYVNAMFKGDAKQVINCMPSFMWEDKDKKKEYIEDLETYFDKIDIDEYKNVRVSIENVDKLSSSDRERLELILEVFEEYYDDFDADDVNVKTAKEIEVKVTYKYDGEVEEETMTVIVIKYKGMWKVLNPGSI